jgi:hypothetical protein
MRCLTDLCPIRRSVVSEWLVLIAALTLAFGRDSLRPKLCAAAAVWSVVVDAAAHAFGSE